MSRLKEICDGLVAKGLMEYNETGTAVRLTEAGAKVVEQHTYGELLADSISTNDDDGDHQKTRRR